MDKLAEQLEEICFYYGIEQFIGFGQGAGANVLSRFALARPTFVEALFLINPSVTQSSWTEWFYQKLNIRQLTAAAATAESRILPQTVQDYLLWYHFGNLNMPDREIDQELVDYYRDYFGRPGIDPYNLALLIESYIKRSTLDLARNHRLRKFRCPVLVLSGGYSPHVEDTVTMNSRLDPTNSSWMKLNESSMVLEEQPGKVAEAFRLFLQGLGYTLRAFEKKRALMSGLSLPCLTNVGSSSSIGDYQRQTRTASLEV